jgi:hypothetical protein
MLATSVSTTISIACNLTILAVTLFSVYGACVSGDADRTSDDDPHRKAIDVVDLRPGVSGDIAADAPTEIGSVADERPVRERFRRALRRNSQGLLLGDATELILSAAVSKLAVPEANSVAGSAATTRIGAAFGDRSAWNSRRTLGASNADSGVSSLTDADSCLSDTDCLRWLLVAGSLAKLLHDVLVLSASTAPTAYGAVTQALWTVHALVGLAIMVVHLHHYFLVQRISDRQASITDTCCTGRLSMVISLGVVACAMFALDIVTVISSSAALAAGGLAAGRETYAAFSSGVYVAWTLLCAVAWVVFMLLARALLDQVNVTIVQCKARKAEELKAAARMAEYSAEFDGGTGTAGWLHSLSVDTDAMTSTEIAQSPVTMAELVGAVDEPVALPSALAVTRPSREQSASLSPQAAQRRGTASDIHIDTNEGGRSWRTCWRSASTPIGASPADDKALTRLALRHVPRRAVMLGFEQATVREVLMALDGRLIALRKARQYLRAAICWLGGVWGTIGLIVLISAAAQPTIRDSPLAFGFIQSMFSLAFPAIAVTLYRSLIHSAAAAGIQQMRACGKRARVRPVASPSVAVLSNSGKAMASQTPAGRPAILTRQHAVLAPAPIPSSQVLAMSRG